MKDYPLTLYLEVANWKILTERFKISNKEDVLILVKGFSKQCFFYLFPRFIFLGPFRFDIAPFC